MCVCAGTCVCVCVWVFVQVPMCVCLVRGGEGGGGLVWRGIRNTMDMYTKYIGLARIAYIYNVYKVFLAGKSPNIRSHTVYVYSFGQPYKRCFNGACEICSP